MDMHQCNLFDLKHWHQKSGKKGRRGDYLERICSYLMTIKPTSVESERAFSSAGNFVVKIKSCLNDDTSDEL